MRKIEPVSFCIPVYNEEKILLRYLDIIANGLKKILGNDNFEIIVVENGSTDRTPQLLKKVKKQHITVTNSEKGLGNAYTKAITTAHNEYLVLSAIDLPFGFSDLENVLPIWRNYDIIYGSKAHPRSHIIAPWHRRIASRFYRLLLKSFFNMPIGDTQGTVFIKKSKVLPMLSKCDAVDAFFTAQLAIYGQKNKLKITEVSVKHDSNNVRIRKSKHNIVKDGTHMLTSMLQQYRKLKAT